MAQTLARKSHVSNAAARDQIDEMVRQILKSLRSGEQVELPGVGKLTSKAPTRRLR